MTEEYVDPEFPEMEVQPEEFPEPEGTPESEAWDGEFSGEIPIPDELREQVDLELIESSPDAEEVFPEFEHPLQGVHPVKEAFAALEYPPREASQAVSQDSGGVLFLSDDDPIRQPLIVEPLDSRPVYTRAVPRRLRHLTCERRGAEYHKPAGLYRPGN